MTTDIEKQCEDLSVALLEKQELEVKLKEEVAKYLQVIHDHKLHFDSELSKLRDRVSQVLSDSRLAMPHSRLLTEVIDITTKLRKKVQDL